MIKNVPTLVIDTKVVRFHVIIWKNNMPNSQWKSTSSMLLKPKLLKLKLS
jgi:hypothetical protein